MRCFRLFVYGSLKRGGRHHAELRGAAFLGEARTDPGYRLAKVGEYLALEPGEPLAAPVTGELFEVSQEWLPALDAFEGEEYRRAELRVTLLGRAAPQNETQNVAAENAEKCLAVAYLRRTR